MLKFCSVIFGSTFPKGGKGRKGGKRRDHKGNLGYLKKNDLFFI